MLTVSDIRQQFKDLLASKALTAVNREESMIEITGSTTIEIIGTTFVADEASIFGEVNWDYVAREKAWYDSRSLNINDFPGGASTIWKKVADAEGVINSNYGWAIYAAENGFANGLPNQGLENASQYAQVLAELKKNPESRRAIMIYTRPSMWLDYNENGRSDFMCTNTVQYMIRGGRLIAIVNMRSNDAILGFKNDRAWQFHIQQKLAEELGVEVGEMIWQVGSLHVYACHYHLVSPTYTK